MARAMFIRVKLWATIIFSISSALLISFQARADKVLSQTQTQTRHSTMGKNSSLQKRALKVKRSNFPQLLICLVPKGLSLVK
jgi:hypothetical protein